MGLTLTSIVEAEPHRSYSFTDHSKLQPGQPQPGDRIDAEFDHIYAVLSDIAASLNTLTQRPQVHLEDLAPGVLASLTLTVTTAAQALLAQVQASGANTLAQADRARQEAARAVAAATQASAASQDTTAAAAEVLAEVQGLEVDAAAVEDAARDAENSANDAELSANQAHRDQELAGAWAEYLEGGDPIPARYFAHTAVTGQHWSSRWWAGRAAAAFGQLSELYLGVWPYPPTTTSTGDPIPTGAIYYNSTLSQVFVWDGTQWQPFWAPSKAYTFSLTYRATAGQTSFPLTTPDLGGEIWTMTPGDPEILEVFLNGVRALAPLDWTVNNATSTVTIAQPLLAGTMVLVDILVSPNRLAPGRVSTLLLLDFNIDPVTGSPGLIDGTRTLFYLARASDRALVPVSLDTDVQIFIDGAVQKPGQDYSVLDDTITFAEPPLPGATAWGILFSPEVEATVRAGDRAHVVRYRTSPTPQTPAEQRQRAYGQRRKAHTQAQIRPNP